MRSCGARTQHIEANPRDYCGQPAAEVPDGAVVGAAEMQSRILGAFLGLPKIAGEPLLLLRSCQGGGERGNHLLFPRHHPWQSELSIDEAPAECPFSDRVARSWMVL